MIKIFIDGSAGTTGLRIRDRLSERSDVSLLSLPERLRKDPAARKEILNSCDAAFLCLPDDAAHEAVGMIENDNVTVFDTSTAHRTDPRFAYGLPELSERHRQKIKDSRRIAVPGCHAQRIYRACISSYRSRSVKSGHKTRMFSLTGYSGGGKNMIARHTSPKGRSPLLSAPRQYGLTQSHKHLKEMTAVTGIARPPVFCPIVADFYSGMEVTIHLTQDDISASPSEIKKIYRNKYSGGMIFCDDETENGFISAAGMSGRDSMQISVCGNDERILLIARYDNLGKGASGAAIQCMNIKFGMNEDSGLTV